RTVLDRVEQQYQGQVIKVEFERDDGRFVYEIRLLQSDGKVVKLEIDAGDGSLISMKRKK
ncbi:MAG: PepSY domain-containing protein, partial [Comamonas sp.]